ncbi:glutathione ABC transporter substrate-binding protein GsiB [Roseomonas elaeocarpi]|uniref:Glutathione-binding protein GsiB n=1 Tax=Roseomonas elaeocarpi TaxID=907779 RepID=A0ABV6JVN3_9PROT
MTDRFSLNRRALLGALGATGALPWLAGATPAAAAANDLVVGVPDNLTGLDPADVNDTLSQSACRLMLQGLYGFDKDMKLIPVLAESYEADADAKVFTFKLRQNVKFHDGTPFDAAAVKANFERVANPDNRLKRQSLIAMLDRVDVVDPQTARVFLKEPFGAFVNTIAHPACMILSPKAIAQYGKDINRNPVGTGPFTFVSWSADTLRVKKSDGYWKPGLPKVDSVTFRSVPENGARIAMLQTGEAQFIYPLPPEMAAVVQRAPNVEIVDAPSIIARYVSMNCMQKPFNDVRVRQALNYAVNKEAYAKVVYNGYAKPLDAPIPAQLGFYSKQQPYPYDVAKAKQLLAEAGYANGFETEMWAQNNTLAQRGMQFMQQQLAAVGVKVNVFPLESGVLQDRIWSVQKPEDAKIQMYYGGWSSSTGDADWGLRPLFWGQGMPPKLYNTAYYSNPEVDKALEAAIATADTSKREDLYKQAQAQIWKDAPWIFLGVEDVLSAKAKRLSNLYRIPDGGLLIEEAAFS